MKLNTGIKSIALRVVPQELQDDRGKTMDFSFGRRQMTTLKKEPAMRPVMKIKTGIIISI